jgi:hypothetical protein
MIPFYTCLAELVEALAAWLSLRQAHADKPFMISNQALLND